MSKQIAITDSYLISVFKLSNQDRKLTLNTIKQLSTDPTTPALHVHSVDRVKCDKKMLSARVNLDLRIIFVNREEAYTLLYVDHHDDAYNWCEGKYFVKTDFGTEYIYDEKLIQEKLDSISNQPQLPEYLQMGGNESLLEKVGIKKKQLVKLGIQDIHADNLLKINDEEMILEYIEIFPEELQEAIIDLVTSAKSYETVYNELFCNDDKSEQSKNSIRRFYTTENMDELEKLMENDDFEKWEIFLHPSQEKLVKKRLRGPFVTEGGPGTGKTIVGIHRAVYLAGNVYKKSEGKRILFCTFSKKLANSISEKISRLATLKGVENNIDVMSVDAYIAQLLGAKALKVNMRGISLLINEVYSRGQWARSKSFYECEYYEVIEKNNIKNEEEYLTVSRKGMGNALQRTERQEIWEFFKILLEEKEKKKIYSFVDRAHQTLELLEKGEIESIYDSIIIDEAQDLEPAKLRAICNSVRTDEDNICILSDHNQRIFRLNTWVGDTGLNVVGRTFYLTVNYRTTKQINEYARYQFIEYDLSNPVNREYISIMNGEDPEVIECKSESDENHIVVSRVMKLLEIFPAKEICVLAPAYEKLNSIKSILEYEQIETFMLTGDEIPGANTGVNLCTTSGVKGLEFSAIIITDYNSIGAQKEMYESNPEIKLDYEKLIECEKYVAVTRARETVIITYVGEE